MLYTFIGMWVTCLTELITLCKAVDANCTSKKIGGGRAHGTWKFLGQGSNLCHSSDPSCYSDNTRSFT